MAISSAGYDGNVDEQQWAGLLSKAGASEYGVDKAGDFAVTAVAGQDRTLSIAPGAAWGFGVLDVMDTNHTVQLATVPSGTRWDMIVLRRDWQPPGGSTSIVVIQGSSAQTLPNRETGKIGVIDDQPIALVMVKAGSTAIQAITDLRVWARNGGVTAKHTLARSYLGAIGTRVEIDGTVWQRRVGANGAAEWVDLATVNDTDWLTKGVAIEYSSYFWKLLSYKLSIRKNRLVGQIVVETRRDELNLDALPDDVRGVRGNITDVKVLELPAGFYPKSFASWPVTIEISRVQQWFGRLNNIGNLVITHGIPGAYIAPGTALTFYLDVPLD